MKKSEFVKTRDQSLSQLKATLEKLKEEAVELKLNSHFAKLKDVHLPRKKRKEIAQIKTIIREKELLGGAETGTK